MNKFCYITILTLLFTFGFKSMDLLAFNQNKDNVEQIKQELKISTSNNRLIVENPDKETVLEIFSIVGVKVFNVKVNTGTNEFPLNLPKGYYIIRVGNTAKKIALR